MHFFVVCHDTMQRTVYIVNGSHFLCQTNIVRARQAVQSGWSCQPEQVRIADIRLWNEPAGRCAVKIAYMLHASFGLRRVEARYGL